MMKVTTKAAATPVEEYRTQPCQVRMSSMSKKKKNVNREKTPKPISRDHVSCYHA